MISIILHQFAGFLLWTVRRRNYILAHDTRDNCHFTYRWLFHVNIFRLRWIPHQNIKHHKINAFTAVKCRMKKKKYERNMEDNQLPVHISRAILVAIFYSGFVSWWTVLHGFSFHSPFHSVYFDVMCLTLSFPFFFLFSRPFKWLLC